MNDSTASDSSLRLACPACATEMRIPSRVLGRPLRCRRCSEVFRAQAPAPKPPGSPRPRAPLAVAVGVGLCALVGALVGVCATPFELDDASVAAAGLADGARYHNALLGLTLELPERRWRRLEYVSELEQGATLVSYVGHGGTLDLHLATPDGTPDLDAPLSPLHGRALSVEAERVEDVTLCGRPATHLLREAQATGPLQRAVGALRSRLELVRLEQRGRVLTLRWLSNQAQPLPWDEVEAALDLDATSARDLPPAPRRTLEQERELVADDAQLRAGAFTNRRLGLRCDTPAQFTSVPVPGAQFNCVDPRGLRSAALLVEHVSGSPAPATLFAPFLNAGPPLAPIETRQVSGRPAAVATWSYTSPQAPGPPLYATRLVVVDGDRMLCFSWASADADDPGAAAFFDSIRLDP
ncbi:MAG: hypothetical protein R3F62_10925 [Planctomycetota bacterium]